MASNVRITAACINKGGAGKTTTSVYLAHRLNKLGRRVLLADYDVQMNATNAFVDVELEAGGSSELFFSDDPQPDVYETESGIYVLPADFGLADAERCEIGTEIKFAKRLRELAEAYGVDDVVIDTPPTLGFGMLAPLCAADYAFAPINLDPLALRGAKNLLLRITDIKDSINPNLEFLGLLVNRLNRTLKSQKEMLAQVENEFGNFLIPEYIGERDAISKIHEDRIPVWDREKQKYSLATREVRKAMNYIINQMGGC